MARSRDHAAHGYSGRGNFCGSVSRCVLWLYIRYTTAKVSEEVNRKCRPRNLMVQVTVNPLHRP